LIAIRCYLEIQIEFDQDYHGLYLIAHQHPSKMSKSTNP